MNEIIEKLLKFKNWKELNEVQKKAVDEGVLGRKDNFVIVAPTASGKTGIAELAILQELENKNKVIYAVPSHALIDDKIKDFQYLTKDFKVKEGRSRYSQWARADLIVTTFELLYRACLITKQFLDDFSLVVVDEFHILYDKLRGYNLEKLLTILKECDVIIICLSATFEDRKEIGEWLGAKVVYIPRKFRPVDLTHDIIDLRANLSNKNLCQKLIEKRNEPYLIFCSTRRFTRDRAIAMYNQLSKIKNDEQEIVKEVKRLISREKLPQLESILCSCLTKGVGFHHSDLHINLRNFVADLFRNKRIDYLFCTTGLAYGINFPARAVVIADLTLWAPEEHRSNPIAQWLYHQMAGRAGRPQYDKKGFCYVVIKKENDLVKFEDYKKAVMPRATSQINYDEYFRKAILELIYSKRNTDKEIVSFFENSLFNFQAIKQESGLIAYNLQELIKNRVKDLHDAGFLERVGLNYQLTDFGNVTLEYLFKGFYSPELSAFIRLKQYLEKTRSVKTDFDLIYFLSKTFATCCISRQPYKKSKEVEQFLQNKGIPDRGNPEYSAYVVYHKWLENVDEAEIDNECMVYSSNLPSKMWEMYRLLDLYEELARTKHYPIPEEFQVFKERIRYGVQEGELPLVKIHGIGRETAGSVRSYCYTVLQKNFGYSGTPLDILKALLEKQGEKKFLDIHIKYIKYVGEARAKIILSFVKNKLGQGK